MAIVKVNYTKDLDNIKEHLRYMVHRPGKDRETMTRDLFDAFDRTDKARAYELIDATRHPLFLKFILNFDAIKEDTYKDLDLQHITRKTLREMQRFIGRNMPFVAVIHDDHTPLRHVIAIGMVQGRISKAAFAKIKTLWKTATAEARSLRRQRDLIRKHPRVQYLAQARVLSQSYDTRKRLTRERFLDQLDQAEQPPKQYRHRKPRELQHGCHHCGYGEFTGIPKSWQYCPSCHRPLKQDKTLRLELSRQL